MPDITAKNWLTFKKKKISYYKLQRTLNLRANPKHRPPYPKLWRQLPIGAQKFRVGAHKFRVGYLIFGNFENKYVNFFLP